ncbi:MAG: drug/metabolite transporter (DMT)-like permease [Porticoccaceae bacterium]|jgi:drug/metabolite transporter (DMT)-like permease
MTNKPLFVGIACMAIGMALIPVGDAIGRTIVRGSEHSPMFVAWSRFMIGAAIVLPLALWMKVVRRYPAAFYYKQAVRGAFIAGTITLIITAVSKSPIADVFGAFFIGPALSVVFSSLLLHEKATKRDWFAVIVGFVGVLMVVQPSTAIGPGIPWALAAGVCYGAFLTSTRWAAGSAPPVAQLLVQFLFGCLFLLPFGIAEFLRIGLQMPHLLLFSALTSGVANLVSIIAIGLAPTALLAPVVYFQIVSATFIGLVFFKDPINAMTMAGLVLIMSTGVLRLPSRSKR